MKIIALFLLSKDQKEILTDKKIVWDGGAVLVHFEEIELCVLYDKLKIQSMLSI
jgi:hypothetical protein